MNDFKLIRLIKDDLEALFEKTFMYFQSVNAIILQTHRSPLIGPCGIEGPHPSCSSSQRPRAPEVLVRVGLEALGYIDQSKNILDD